MNPTPKSARAALFPLWSLLLCAACGSGPAPGLASRTAQAVSGEQQREREERGAPARGSFSCDFDISPDVALPTVPALIERDRMYMAERPGMIRKQLPIGVDFATGAVHSGGRYQFDTAAHARDYLDWVKNGFVLDGVHFLSRSMFVAPECHAWEMLAIAELLPLGQQLVMRTERFALAPKQSGEPLREALRERFEGLRHEARARGYAAVWLDYSEEEGLAQVVTFADRVVPRDPSSFDFQSLGALSGAPPLGAALEDLGARTFDRTEWVFTVWFPYSFADSGAASLWPWSPPLPQPGCGDGVCEPSRGESGASCAADCPALCGDGVCQAGEDTHNCPSDCRP